MSFSLEKDIQRFEVCSLTSFSYKELKENIEKCLAKISRIAVDASEEEMEELRTYMNSFISDVESDKNIEAFEKLRVDRDLASFVRYAGDYLEKNKDEDLEEIPKVVNTPRDKLPLIINILDSDSALDILNKKLSGTLP